MAEFRALMDAGLAFGEAAISLVAAVLGLIASRWFFVTWIVFWLYFVRWSDLRAQLKAGAGPAVALLYFLVCLVWGLCTEPSDAFGEWRLPSLVEKFALGAFWLLLAFGCGALQDHWNTAPPEVEIAGPPEGASASHAAHGHHAAHGDH